MANRQIPAPSESAATAAGRARAPSWRRTLREAERRIRLGLYADGIARIEQAIDEGADVYDCRIRIAEVHRILERWPQAILEAERAIAAQPGRLRAHEVVMSAALDAGQYERARMAAEGLIGLCPNHIAAHSALVTACLQVGDVDRAIRAVSTLVRLDPDNAIHRFKKGLLCQHRGDIAGAVREFSEAVRLDSDGSYGDAARDALDTLDSFQLDQIFTLTMEDVVFRAKLVRDTVTATFERGFVLTEAGIMLLSELIADGFTDMPTRQHSALYH